MDSATFVSLAKKVDNLSENKVSIPDFNRISELSSNWRNKVSVLKKFSAKVFGADKTHLVIRALAGPWTWEKLDPVNECSPLHDLVRSKTPHKNTTAKAPGSLKVKIRVVKKLCDLSGSGDTNHFVINRILKPSWNIVSEFIRALPSVYANSSNQKTVIKALVQISQKASENDNYTADLLMKASNRVAKTIENKSASFEKALRSLAKLLNSLQKPSDDKKFATQKQMDQVKLIMSCVSPHLRNKDLEYLGFKTSWRTRKRALQLFEDENSPQEIVISKSRGNIPLQKKFRKLIKDTFTDSNNVSQGMRRPVKKALGLDGLPKNALEMNRSMTRIINSLDYVVSKKERKEEKKGISESSIRKYAVIEVPELKKHRKRTGKCSMCHEYAQRCAWFNSIDFGSNARDPVFARKEPTGDNTFPTNNQIDLLQDLESSNENLLKARIKRCVRQLKVLEFHYNDWRSGFKFWQRLERNCPEDVLLTNADHMNSPTVGGGGKVEFNDTPHELRTKTCFGFAVGVRGEEGKVQWHYSLTFSDSVDHRSQAVIQMKQNIMKQRWFRQLARGKKRAFHGHDNAPSFISKEHLYEETIRFAYALPTIETSSFIPFGKCHGKGINDKIFQKVSQYVKSSENRLSTVDDLQKCCMDGQKEANKSKMRLKNEKPTPFRAYTYKIKKPSKLVNKVCFSGIQSSLAFTYIKSTDTLINNILPENVLTGDGIPVPKSMITKSNRKDRTLRRETTDAFEADKDYEKVSAQEIQQRKWLKKLEILRNNRD